MPLRDDTAVKTGAKRPASGLLQSLQRGVAVLTCVGEAQRPLTAREIAESLGLDRTVTHRILRTLESDALLTQVSGRYELGPGNLVIANMYLDRSSVRRAALPYQLDFLYRGFPEKPWALTVMLRVGGHVTDVSRVWSPRAPLDSLLSVGPKIALENAAAGRCVLAFLDHADVVDLLGEERAAELEPRLETIRQTGGIDRVVESERPGIPPGLAALSAVILTRTGTPVAGLTVSGTELAEHLEPNSDVAIRLRRTANEIGRLLA